MPRALSDAEASRLLSSFVASLPSARPGYAMARCALDMGQRCGEVAKLQLADIDWRNGTVTLRRTMSRREDILPLPALAGRALADYLRYERPKTTNPAVFVRRQAPRDKPIGVDRLGILCRTPNRAASDEPADGGSVPRRVHALSRLYPSTPCQVTGKREARRPDAGVDPRLSRSS